MKPVVWIAILLIVLGIVAVSYQGVVWITGKEEVARVGPVRVERERDFPIPLAPIVGGVAIVGGIILLATGRRGTA